MRVRKQLVASSQNISSNPNTRRSVTVHDTGNTGRGANAAAHANLQSRPNPRVASWHYQVDDQESVQSFPHSARTFHAGTAQGNRESISVEICVNSDGDYALAVRNAAIVVANILREENLPLSAVVQHHHWTRKHCPAGVRESRAGINWAAFMALVAIEREQPGSTGPVAVLPPTIGTPTYPSVSASSQEMLAITGHYAGAVFDGIHGPMSVAATKSFQSAHGLVEDGVLGPKTQAQLTKEYDMSMAKIDRILQIAEAVDVRTGNAGGNLAIAARQVGELHGRVNFSNYPDGKPMRIAVQGDVDMILRAVAGINGADVDEDAVARAVVALLPAGVTLDPAVLAQSVTSELALRLAS